MNHKLSRCIAIILFLHIISASVFMTKAQKLPDPVVGAIPGTVDVSPMGAATYTIPIEVVPDTQGVQPNLSIVYNSIGGMGLLGMKWNLAGLSAITRCGHNLYYDDDITAIDFDNNVTFALDGERLKRIANINANGIKRQYATEMENFTRVYSHGMVNRPYPPTHFTTYTDNGTVVYRHISSQIYNPSPNVPGNVQTYQWWQLRSSKMFFIR